jgi:glycosyltransferase involved in cell wall biosynthesis
VSHPITPDSLYLVLPVPFRVADGVTCVEAQAANGLDRWADHFAHLTVAAPVVPAHQAANIPNIVWRDGATLQHRDRIEIQPLPWAYSPGPFVKQLAATRALIAVTIARSQHLQFAIGGLLGDWAAIAALEAIQQHRRYAIHTDRVEHELMQQLASTATGLRRLKIAIEAPIMARYHRHLIAHCALGLWHGDDCFRAYAPWATAGGCRENHLIHDVHTKPADLISDAQLATKLASLPTADTLDIVYAGRLDPMKAPLAWLQAIATARDRGARLSATWYGDGSLLAAAQAEATRLHLHDIVHFPGFLADRAALLDRIRRAHILLFTHVTPESPRILLEALVSGTPIVGFDTGYATNLLEGHGGGAIAPLQNTEALASHITTLATNRPHLVQLTHEAAKNGRRFTDAAVFAERSALIHEHA